MKLNDLPLRIGVGVLVCHPEDSNKILVGRRRGSHGAGKIALPGGAVEVGEDYTEAAIRELYEETGLETKYSRVIEYISPLHTTKHCQWITAIVLVYPKDISKLQLKEPEKCEGWYFEDFQKVQDSGELFEGSHFISTMSNTDDLHFCGSSGWAEDQAKLNVRVYDASTSRILILNDGYIYLGNWHGYNAVKRKDGITYYLNKDNFITDEVVPKHLLKDK